VVNDLETKTYVPHFLTSNNCAFCPYIIKSDQKVSAHLMITIQSSGAHRLFDHPVFVFLVILQKDPETIFPNNFNCMVVLIAILILSSYLCLGLTRGLINLDFHPQVFASVFSPMHDACLPVWYYFIPPPK